MTANIMLWIGLPLWVTLLILIAYSITVFTMVVVVLSENRNPIRSLAWVLALLFLPGIGLVFYLFFGRSLRGQHIMSRRNKRKLLNRFHPRTVNLEEQPLSSEEKTLVKLARNLSTAIYTVNNELRIFTIGRDKFESLRYDLRHAKRSIYLQYYIFSDDELGTEISDLLIEKAREGVEVKVIYDHVGSFSAKNKFFRRMRDNGVEIHPFFKVTFPQLANRINWRNHRKIVVIDSEIGYIGGMNIADRYEKGSADGSAWRDTHFRLRGDIVDSLAYSFLVDWNFQNTTQKVDYHSGKGCNIHNHVGMQLVTSGPTGAYNNIALCFQKAISTATKSIYIQTPYFLPTDGLLHALEAAALANIDVRIMMPRRSDSKMLQYASFSYVTQCLKAGIKIYLFEPSMLHVKAMIVDDTLVTAGSTNFDFRSFENNFEANLFIYDRSTNRAMRDIFFSDLSKCTRIRLNTWIERPRLQRTMESLVRLVAPIL
ncbi:MAG: cardiolipin synthase [Muribaculaceae bacterium]|nr:cardiolipin synthase [Muribaculaceae bacterium]MDE6866131.1 cardiolipin synthase [Muribaculaceae bacterium]